MTGKGWLVCASALLAMGAATRCTAAARRNEVAPEHVAGITFAPVETGIDVLEAERFAPLRGMTARQGGSLNIGLVTDVAGVDSHGRRTIDVLAKDAEEAVPGLKLTKLFGARAWYRHLLRLDQYSEQRRSGDRSARYQPLRSNGGAASSHR